jgi:hypothetical protein
VDARRNQCRIPEVELLQAKDHAELTGVAVTDTVESMSNKTPSNPHSLRTAEMISDAERREIALDRIRKWQARDLEGELSDITLSVLHSVNALRFWRTERGFHGEFHAILRSHLKMARIIRGDCPLLEQEYQKSGRHDTNQRPDSVLHIPAEDYNLSESEGNFAVWAFKYNASEPGAKEDLSKLEGMISGLRYQIGFFINIQARNTYVRFRPTRLGRRLVCIATWRDDNGQVKMEVA